MTAADKTFHKKTHMWSFVWVFMKANLLAYKHAHGTFYYLLPCHRKGYFNSIRHLNFKFLTTHFFLTPPLWFKMNGKCFLQYGVKRFFNFKT